jgi:hypothetical protein
MTKYLYMISIDWLLNEMGLRQIETDCSQYWGYDTEYKSTRKPVQSVWKGPCAPNETALLVIMFLWQSSRNVNSDCICCQNKSNQFTILTFGWSKWWIYLESTCLRNGAACKFLCDCNGLWMTPSLDASISPHLISFCHSHSIGRTECRTSAAQSSQHYLTV